VALSEAPDVGCYPRGIVVNDEFAIDMDLRARAFCTRHGLEADGATRVTKIDEHQVEQIRLRLRVPKGN